MRYFANKHTHTHTHPYIIFCLLLFGGGQSTFLSLFWCFRSFGPECWFWSSGVDFVRGVPADALKCLRVIVGWSVAVWEEHRGRTWARWHGVGVDPKHHSKTVCGRVNELQAAVDGRGQTHQLEQQLGGGGPHGGLPALMFLFVFEWQGCDDEEEPTHLKRTRGQNSLYRKTVWACSDGLCCV